MASCGFLEAMSQIPFKDPISVKPSVTEDFKSP